MQRAPFKEHSAHLSVVGNSQLSSKPGVHFKVFPVVHPPLLDMLIGQWGGGDASQEYLLLWVGYGDLDNAQAFLQREKAGLPRREDGLAPQLT